jgi:glutamate/aspartate transport system substrate-binding protein
MIRLVLALALLAAAPARADETLLAGTLKKLHETGRIAIGYREASVPFSFLNRAREPVGYAIDLCREIADEAQAALGDGAALKVEFVPVTAETRLARLRAGDIDLECGSTTANEERRREVAFSPITFVAGTKLLVPVDSPVHSYRDLAGKTVVVTAGTTNAAALRRLSDRQSLGMKFIEAPDHAQSYAILAAGKADAFATDDILLQGFVATMPDGSRFHVVGDYLSYEPYGIVYRRDDPDFAAVVDHAFARLAAEGRLADLYARWFTQRLPTGETLNLPMSPQLAELFRVLGQPD